MSISTVTPDELYAQLYDTVVADWPEEIPFYVELAAQTTAQRQEILEVACGTGRVAIRLLQDGARITGLDLSPELLQIAREKTTAVTWVQGDMRSFDLGKQFGLILISGHAFQFMVIPEDQVQCLECLKRHLLPGGRLVVHLDHQDIGWLAGLPPEGKGVFEIGREIIHPITEQKIRSAYAWVYEPATQTATVTLRWEAIGERGEVVQVWQLEPMPLHCVFRFEMEHVLKRVGLDIEAVYGDFFKNELNRDSGQMIWMAKNP